MKHKIAGNWNFRQGLSEVSSFIDFLKVYGTHKIVSVQISYNSMRCFGCDFVGIIHTKPIPPEPIPMEMIDNLSFFKKDDK